MVIIGQDELLTTLLGSLCPGRYFTFSWSVLIISVSLRPFTISSNTHIFTTLSNLELTAALAPTIFAMAEPLQKKNKSELLLQVPFRSKRVDDVDSP